MIPSGSPCTKRSTATRGRATRPPGDERSALLRIGVPRETKARETRVAATPTTVEQLIKLGFEVVVETGAGAASSFPDEAYADAGAQVVEGAEAWASDVVLRVNAPATDELDKLKD